MQASEDSNGDLKEARGLLKEAMIEQEEAHVEVQKAAKGCSRSTRFDATVEQRSRPPERTR